MLSVIVGWSWRDALEAFVVTNSLMGVAFAGCGGILVWHRSRNPIGWLFVVAGLAHATTAVAAPALQLLIDAEAPLPAQRLALTAFAWSWPWSIALCLPLALLLFPDGHPPSRGGVGGSGRDCHRTLFALEMGASPERWIRACGRLSHPPATVPEPLWIATEIRGALAMCAGLAALAVRYRRGSEVERRQLLWLLLACVR